MGLFDDIGKRIAQSTSETAKKTRGFVEVSKLNSQISDEKKAILSLYTQIGEKYYETFSANPEEELSHLCEQITATNQKIIALQAEIQKVRNVRVCPGCGAECTGALAFCGACGESLPKEETPDKKFCVNCGAQLSLTATFCTECGQKVQ